MTAAADNISEEAEDAVGLDVADIAASVRRKGQRRERSKGVWVCDWPKDRILEVSQQAAASRGSAPAPLAAASRPRGLYF